MIHIQLRQPQVRVERGVDPGLLGGLLESLGATIALPSNTQTWAAPIHLYFAAVQLFLAFTAGLEKGLFLPPSDSK